MTAPEQSALGALSAQLRNLSEAIGRDRSALLERVGRVEARQAVDGDRLHRMEATLSRIEAAETQGREQMDAIDAEAEAAAETASATSARQRRDAETARLQIEALDGRLAALDDRLAGLSKRLDAGVRVTLSPALAAAIVTTLGAVLAAAVSQIAPIIHALRGRP